MHEYEGMNNEIQIKIGGDHGDISIAKSKGLMRNTELTELQSQKTETVFCAFEAKDKTRKDKKTNCKTALIW